MAEFFDAGELRALTGYKPAGKQDCWLKDRGIPHHRDGPRIIVSRWHVEAVQRQEAKPQNNWRPYIIGPDLDILPACEYHPTILGGIYFLIEEDGGLLYIGQSYSIGYRVVQHYWAMQRGQRSKFTGYGCVDVPGWLMTDIETAYIHALDPPENRHMPRVSWIHHDAAVAAIRELWGEKR